MSTPFPQPLSSTWVLRLVCLALVLVSLAAGYYQATLKLYQKKYWALERQYLKTQAELTKYQTGN